MAVGVQPGGLREAAGLVQPPVMPSGPWPASAAQEPAERRGASPLRASAAHGRPGELPLAAMLPGAAMAAPVPRRARRADTSAWGIQARRAMASSSPRRATAGRVRVRRDGRLSAGCAVPGCPRRQQGRHGQPPRGDDEGDERPTAHPWARAGAAQDRRRAASLLHRHGHAAGRLWLDPRNTDCRDIRGARVPAGPRLSSSIDGDASLVFQDQIDFLVRFGCPFPPRQSTRKDRQASPSWWRRPPAAPSLVRACARGLGCGGPAGPPAGPLRIGGQRGAGGWHNPAWPGPAAVPAGRDRWAGDGDPAASVLAELERALICNRAKPGSGPKASAAAGPGWPARCRRAYSRCGRGASRCVTSPGALDALPTEPVILAKPVSTAILGPACRVWPSGVPSDRCQSASRARLLLRGARGKVRGFPMAG